MTYFDRHYSQIWEDFFAHRLSMNKREAALEPKRERLYSTQFPRQRTVRKTKRDDSMSRAEMLEWSVRQGVKSRMGE